MTDKELIGWVREQCLPLGLTLVLSTDDRVTIGGTACNGVFDSETRELSVALGASSWRLTILHEFSHGVQFSEECESWKEYCEGPYDALWTWLSGEEVEVSILQESIRLSLNLERDCEIRTSRLIADLGICPVEEYIQKAFAYLAFYLHLFKTRRWYRIGCEPYTLPLIWSQAPTTFDVSVAEAYQTLGPLYDLYC